ncbi:MAG: hypothetical protein HY436_00120 [Candidatus Liptonbacteria bacterium]|nr:hypothetical protein [Candidatus Liptonbacteria bacterium]
MSRFTIQKHMSKIAVDVVLLPSNEMAEAAVSENERLVRDFKSKIVLNRETCMPHISLAMGVLADEKKSKVEQILAEVVSRLSVMHLTAVAIYVSEGKEGFSGIVIENTSEIQNLHETVTKQLAPLLSFDATSEMFVRSGEFEERTSIWANAYHKKASFEKYWPHITTGYGSSFSKDTTLTFPLAFTAPTLALCQMGSHCTCRRVLWSSELRV